VFAVADVFGDELLVGVGGNQSEQGGHKSSGTITVPGVSRLIAFDRAPRWW
jgi:hypothetical protein